MGIKKDNKSISILITTTMALLLIGSIMAPIAYSQGFSETILGQISVQGTPTGGVQVTGSWSGGSSTDSTTSTGNYHLDVPSGTHVTVVAKESGGHTATGYIDTPVNGSPPTQTLNLNIAWINPVSVSGSVTVQGATAADGTIVTATWSGGSTSTTTSGGSFTLTNVPGATSVTVTATEGGGHSASSAAFTTHSDGSATNGVTIAITWIKAVQISGRVTVAGSPADGVTVACTGMASVTTSGGGYYTFNNVPGNTPVTIKATEPHGNNAQTSFTTHSDGSAHANVDLAITYPTVSITGTVRVQGTPTGNVPVTITWTGGSASGTTGANGVYTISGVAGGTQVNVSATSSGHSSLISIPTGYNGGTCTGADISIGWNLPTVTISGNVTSQGTAIDGATVTITWSGGSASGTTSGGGHFSISGIPGGNSVTITVKESGGHTTSQTISTNADGTGSSVDLAITWSTGGSGGNGGSYGNIGITTPTPSETANETVTATPTITVTPTASPTVTPTPTPTPGGSGIFSWLWAILAAVIIAIVFIGYFILSRRK